MVRILDTNDLSTHNYHVDQIKSPEPGESVPIPAVNSNTNGYVENYPTPICPMCNIHLTRDSIQRLIDSNDILNQWINSLNVDICENESNEKKNIELNK
ncbi:unnamed protein product [Schistosoma margrebowiei]|uniref:Uncharacterized protein n=1 Tax=Schistosoma margrebowiei TaxID=48269 RepID=A0A183N400_9TREM|nr:unnamed protein product [Schistosoma margrebowiei]